MRTVSRSNLSWLKSPRSIPRSYITASKWKALREHLTSLYVVFLFTYYLFYVEADGYDVMDIAKQRAFYILHLVFIGAVLCTYGIQNLLACKGKKFAANIPQLNFVETLSVLYLLLVWVSALRSAYWPATIQGLQPCEGAVAITLYVCTFILLSKYGKVHSIMYGGLGVIMTLFCSICLLQLLGLNPFSLFQGGTVYSDYGTDVYVGQFCGTLGNTNLVALFLVLGTLVLIGCLFRLKSNLRFMLVIPVSMSVLVLLGIDVSLGILGVVVGFLLALPFLVSKKYRKSVILSVLSLGVVGITVLWFCDIGAGTLHEFHNMLHGQVDLSYGSGRLYIWDSLLCDMEGHWLWGHGPDTVMAADIQPFVHYSEELGAEVVGMFADAHNSYLNTLYCCGLPTLVVFLTMDMYFAVSCIRLAGKNLHVAILGAAFIGVSVASFFCISHFIVSPFIWCLKGLLESEITRASH